MTRYSDTISYKLDVQAVLGYTAVDRRRVGSSRLVCRRKFTGTVELDQIVLNHIIHGGNNLSLGPILYSIFSAKINPVLRFLARSIAHQ